MPFATPYGDLSIPGDDASAEHESGRQAREIQPAEVETVHHVAAKYPHVAHVAAKSEVIVEKPHHAGAGIPAELIRGRRHLEHAGRASPVDLGAQQADAPADVRANATARRAADGNADDDVP